MNFSLKFPGKSKEPLTLLDIGSDNIKFIALDSKQRIEKVDFLPIPEIEPELEEIPKSREFLTAQGLRRIFSKNPRLSRNLYSVLSDRAVFIRVIRLFPMSRGEMEKAINYEAKLQVPFPMDKTRIDYFILGTVLEKNLKKNEILLMVIPQESIDYQTGIFAKAELSPRVIDLGALASWRVFLANYPHLISKTVALLDLGAGKSEINIIKKGNLCFSRIIPLGGLDFTRAIKEEMNVDLQEAEQMKKEYASASRLLWSVEEGQEQLTEKVYAVISPLFSQLLNDIRRSLEFYLSQFPSSPVEMILLTGGGANLKGIEDYLSENLNRLTVEKFRFRLSPMIAPTIDGASREILKKSENLLILAPLLGLASHDEAKAKINLVSFKPAAQEKGGRLWQKLTGFSDDPMIKWLVVSGLILILVAVISIFGILNLEKKYTGKIKKQQELLASLESQKKDYSLAGKNQGDLTLEKEILENSLAKGIPLNELLEGVSRSTPAGLVLDQIKLDYVLKQVEIGGRAEASEAVNNFVENLNDQKKFRTMTLAFIRDAAAPAEKRSEKYNKIFRILGEVL